MPSSTVRPWPHRGHRPGARPQRNAVARAIGSQSENVTGTLDANFRLTTLLANNPEQSLQTTGAFAVRNGSFPSIAFKGMTLPSGDSHFSSFGGDLRIARERGYSSKLTMVASEMQATISGSFGFDRSLQYSGHAVVDPATQGTSLTSSPLLASLQPILAGVLQKNVGLARVSVPFTLSGTLDNPQFAMAGTPQLIGGQVRVKRRSCYPRRRLPFKT